MIDRYTLTGDDRAVVAHSVATYASADEPARRRLLDIHLAALDGLAAQRTRLLAELASVDRSITMRQEVVDGYRSVTS